MQGAGHPLAGKNGKRETSCGTESRAAYCASSRFFSPCFCGRAALAADWAVSITGIVGPTGGSAEKPVGTVCFGVVGPDYEEATTHHFDGQLNRQEMQRQAAVFAFDLLLRSLR